MRIVYLGSGEFGIDCLNVLKDCEHSLELIVTGPARRAGRGRGERATAVCCWATAAARSTFASFSVSGHEQPTSPIKPARTPLSPAIIS